MTKSIEAYDFAHAALDLYEFFWSELCDWYLEIVKPRLYDGDEDASATLLWALEQVLALAHPFMPFVTEEIYSYLPSRPAEALVVHPFPEADDALVDEEAEREIGQAIELTRALRRWRDLAGVPVKQVLAARADRRPAARAGLAAGPGRVLERRRSSRSPPSAASSCSRPRASTPRPFGLGSRSAARSCAPR